MIPNLGLKNWFHFDLIQGQIFVNILEWHENGLKISKFTMTWFWMMKKIKVLISTDTVRWATNTVNLELAVDICTCYGFLHQWQ